MKPLNILLIAGMLFTNIAAAGFPRPARQSGFSCAAVTEISQVECESLVALYNSTNGDNWRIKDGWLVSNNPHEWDGVTVSGQKYEDGKWVGGEVTTLRLTYNDLSGPIPDLNLPSLTTVNLSHNQLSTLPSNPNFPSLTKVDLSYNDLRGPIPDLNLPSLTTVNLCYNDLSGPIPDLNLPSLTTVNLSYNDLSGPIPDLNLPNLTTLYLYNNQLTALPSNPNLPNLHYLYLNNNQLSALPSNLNFPNLITLDLSNNQLSGTIPDLNFPYLTTMNLSNNQLSGTIPDLNLPDLIEVSLSNNQLSGPIPDLNLPSLNVAFLSNNHLSALPSNPNLPDLSTVDLSNNQLSGPIPDLNLPSLTKVYLENNQLSALPSNPNLPKLWYVDLNNNQLSGPIPDLNLPSLTTVNLSFNQLSALPSNPNLPSLTTVDLSSNQLSGPIPDLNLPSLAHANLKYNQLSALPSNPNLPSLFEVILSHNQLSGPIPDLNLPNLHDIYLNNNDLSGPIPDLNLPNLITVNLKYNQLSALPSNPNLPNLTTVDLSNNDLSGPIPDLNLPDLTTADLSHNQLSALPSNPNLPYLSTVDLSYNDLSGPIPDVNLPYLTRADLQYNQLSGPIPDLNLPNLTTADLQYNQLSALPSNPNLPKLTDVYLSHNQLSGPIPDLNLPSLTTVYLYNNQLSALSSNPNLPKLTYLYLSNNQLSGPIPDVNLPSLTTVKLDNNRLSGPIPDVNLPSLTTVYLYNNQLSALPSNPNLPRLTTVHLQINQLSGSIPDLNLPSLTYANVSINNLSGNIPESVMNSPLTNFNIHYNCLNIRGLSAPLEAFLNTRASGWEFFQGGDRCYHTITGKVLDANGNPLAGVTISDGGTAADASARGHSTTTASDGSYSLSGLPARSYTLKPAKNAYKFTPPSIQVNVSTADVNGQDFIGTKLPVILLPGFMGSHLYNTPQGSEECKSRPSGNIWFGPFHLDVLYLQASSVLPANPCDRVSAQGILDDSYSDMLNKLKEEGYTTYTFAYDWRLDLDVNTNLLDQMVEEVRSKEGVKQVILLGHSMGGLLARDYITSSARAEKVAQVISVGSPYWGAPQLAYAMRTGNTGISMLGGLSSVQNAFKEILRNSPGAMELLPSPAYVTQFYPFYQVRSGLLGYEESVEYFSATGQNTKLITDAKAFHSKIDDFRDSNLNGVDYDILYTTNYKTPALIRETPCWDEKNKEASTCYEVVAYTNGDGAVPSASAQLRGKQGDWGGSATIYNVEAGKQHQELMQDAAVQSQVSAILKSEDSGSADLAGIDSVSAPADETTSQPFIEVLVKGGGLVSVRDEANRSINMDAEGNIINQIPYSTYIRIDNATTITLPTNIAYNLSIEQTDGTPIQVQVSDFRMQGDDEMYTPYQRTLFIDAPLASGGIANVRVDYAVGLSHLLMRLDQDADGWMEDFVEQTSVLDQTQSQDYTPPVTTVQVSGTSNAVGYFTVTVSSSDKGTGVLKTEFSLDNAKTWRTYSGPILITPEQVPVFLARSMDKAGNREYPFARKNMIFPHIYSFLPIVVR